MRHKKSVEKVINSLNEEFYTKIKIQRERDPWAADRLSIGRFLQKKDNRKKIFLSKVNVNNIRKYS